MQSMQPIPIERALVPVLTAELTPKREPGLLARAFSERKRLYALFFAVFFVFVSAGVLAFFQLNSASEQQALSAQMQASVRFAGEPTPANAFALSRRELMLAAVAGIVSSFSAALPSFRRSRPCSMRASARSRSAIRWRYARCLRRRVSLPSA